LVQGEALLLIYKGKLNFENIQKAKITLDEIKESIREHGVASIEEVDLAILEMDGNISIRSHEFQHRTIRKRKSHHSRAKLIIPDLGELSGFLLNNPSKWFIVYIWQ
jgi:uncharacterized membrane protein YcaP (DUF421 family)